MTARAVERQHQLSAWPFAQRLLRDERRELADERGVASKRKVGLDPLLEHGEAALLEARDLGPSEVVVGEIGQRRPAPQRERFAQLLGRFPRLGVACLVDQLLEPVHVELAGGDLQDVAAGPGEQHLVAERLAQLRDVALQRLGGGLRRLLAPELLDQALAPDELVRPQREDREQLALSAAADDERPIAVSDLKWAK